MMRGRRCEEGDWIWAVMVRAETRRRKGHVAIIAIGRLILEEGGLWLVRLLRVVLRHEAVGECVLLLLPRRVWERIVWEDERIARRKVEGRLHTIEAVCSQLRSGSCVQRAASHARAL